MTDGYDNPSGAEQPTMSNKRPATSSLLEGKPDEEDSVDRPTITASMEPTTVTRARKKTVSLNLRDFGFAFSLPTMSNKRPATSSLLEGKPDEEDSVDRPISSSQDENEKAKPKSLKFKLTVFFLALVTVVGSMDV
jgi:cell division protein FtsN